MVFGVRRESNKKGKWERNRFLLAKNFELYTYCELVLKAIWKFLNKNDDFCKMNMQNNGWDLLIFESDWLLLLERLEAQVSKVWVSLCTTTPGAGLTGRPKLLSFLWYEYTRVNPCSWGMREKPEGGWTLGYPRRMIDRVVLLKSMCGTLR